MISKSLGQILRVSCAMHILFSLEDEQTSQTITVNTIDAAIHFVEVCCQQTAYISGRGELEQELKTIMEGKIQSVVYSVIIVKDMYDFILSVIHTYTFTYIHCI